jgi:protein ImuA
MAAVLKWAGDEEEPSPASCPSSQNRQRGWRTPGQPFELPPEISAAIWRGTELGSSVTKVLSSGFAALDAELPGAGWPCHSLTEILQPQPTVTEWRLLAPAIRQVVASGLQVVIVGPPKTPHLPGLRFAGLDERHLVWVQAETPSERLWVTEQLVKANSAGLLVSWLPQARQEQIRRLQVCASACDGPVFLCRPMAAEFEPSAAPLRVQLRFVLDWELRVHVLKRKGPTHEGDVALASIPGGLQSVITPRLLKPSEFLAARDVREREPSHALGSPASRQTSVRRVTAH